MFEAISWISPVSFLECIKVDHTDLPEDLFGHWGYVARTTAITFNTIDGVDMKQTFQALGVTLDLRFWTAVTINHGDPSQPMDQQRVWCGAQNRWVRATGGGFKIPITVNHGGM